MSYTYGSWSGTTQKPNRHSPIWVANQFTISYKALECISVRTSRKEVLDLTILPAIYLELLSLNQIYTTTGNYIYVIDKSVTPVNMAILLDAQLEKRQKPILINVILVVLKSLTLLLIIVLIK